jgi:NADP-dependent aldehyde dehydrogenase
VLKRGHFIGGKWISTEQTFKNEPVSGKPDEFCTGTTEMVSLAASEAERAFLSYSNTTEYERATFLREIANEIDQMGDEITEMGMKETGLPKGRLDGERLRTVNQLKMFASHIEKEMYLDKHYDFSVAQGQSIRLIQRPIGPVAVFGASNFPLAFSVAGGDTASALAAGCPVVVKANSSHPGTSDLVTQAIEKAMVSCDIDRGVFSLIQGGDRKVGAALVVHPFIKAVGFTGSYKGGKALFDLCVNREDPIPFFGEMGSINPMFVLPDALKKRSEEIAKGWVNSLVLGVGQFCTNPGIAIVIKGDLAEKFISSVKDELRGVSENTMLNDKIAKTFIQRCELLSENKNIKNELFIQEGEKRSGAPRLYSTSAAAWLSDTSLQEEVFGPSGIVVVADDAHEALLIAKRITGQLTVTLQMDQGDTELTKTFIQILERKAGRLIINGYPTGVEVCDSMVHGGPFPASTNFGATSVGTMAIRRFLRPVCYQGFEDEMVPEFFK